MARMPGAIWKPLAADWASQPRMRAYDFFCLHTMVGGLDGTDGYFRNKNGVGYGGTESHFGVGPDGTIYQWQDTDFQADANGNGNWHVISSENADTGAPFPAWGGSDVPAFTPQQIEANARIAVWLWQTHKIPLDVAGSSIPGARGLAVHRYGVPGYMPAGAEQWSSSTGKACPGDRRIAQAPAVSARAKQLLGGAPAVTPEPIPLGDEDMCVLRDNKGTIYLDTGYELQATGSLTVAGLWMRKYGAAIPCTEGEIGTIRADNEARRARLLTLLAQAAGGDVDEAQIVAGLIPAISEALAGKSGATREEIAEMLAGITLRAS